MRMFFVEGKTRFLIIFLIITMMITQVSLPGVDGFTPQTGKVVVIGFGIGHIDTLEPSTVSAAKSLLINSVKWTSNHDAPKILLLVDPSVQKLGGRSLDPDFILDTLNEYSVDKVTDTFEGISLSELESYDVVIWSGEYSPLPSPSHSSTTRTLLEYFESGHGVILISDDASWDLTTSDPKTSSEFTRSLTQVATINTGISRDVQTVISTFEGQQHPIMEGILRINVLKDDPQSFEGAYYANDIDDSLPSINAKVLATNVYGNPTVIAQEFTGNRFPINALDDQYSVLEDSKNNNFFVLYNDASQKGRLSIDSFDASDLKGDLILNSDSFIFIPEPDFEGNTGFSYFVSDSLGNRDVALVNISVTPINDPPVAKDATFSISEDTSLKSKLQSSDIDGDPLKFSVVSSFDQGTGKLILYDDGRVEFHPKENFVGLVNFDYVVSDGALLSSPANVQIKIIAENDDPVPRTGVYSVDEDKVLSGILSAIDPDGDPLSYSLLYDTPVTTGQTSVMTHGAFAFIPVKGFFGQTYFVYEVDDGKTKTQHTVFINVIPKSDPPEAINKKKILDEDSKTSIVLEGVDSHGYDLDFRVVETTKFGTIDGTGNNLIYTPDENYFGSDELTFEVDNGRFTDLGTVSITVNSVNDPPVAVEDSIFTQENTEIAIPVLLNDVDIDGDELVVTYVDDPVNGKAEINLGKLISYTPNPGVVNDLEIFNYVISDSFGATSTGKIIVEILQKADSTGGVKLEESSFDGDTTFSFDVNSDEFGINGKISYRDSFAAINLNSEEITFFSIDQQENSATFGGVSFTDQYYSIFVDDNGSSGRDDIVKIKIRNSDGSLVYQKEGTTTGNVIVNANYVEIPNWFKNTAKWWSNNQIADSDFLKGVQFLITNGIIKLPSIPEISEKSSKEIPLWIKNNAKWWSEGKLSDLEFVSGIEFLVEEGILKI
ncbi:MAG: tandem-95 repeat protein [Nitrosopumilus sp.]|nr:MAG: tandem-95 repeat protein [Nitrosopumilus sp.]